MEARDGAVQETAKYQKQNVIAKTKHPTEAPLQVKKEKQKRKWRPGMERSMV